MLCSVVFYSNESFLILNLVVRIIGSLLKNFEENQFVGNTEFRMLRGQNQFIM